MTVQTGTVEAINRKGLRLDGEARWYRYAREFGDYRYLPRIGTGVQLQLDSEARITDMAGSLSGPADAAPAAAMIERATETTLLTRQLRLRCFEATTRWHLLASDNEETYTSIIAYAERLYAWVTESEAGV